MKSTPTNNHSNTRLTRDAVPEGPRRRMTCASTSRRTQTGGQHAAVAPERASAPDECRCQAASAIRDEWVLRPCRSSQRGRLGDERSGVRLDAARSSADGMTRSEAKSRAQTTIRERPRVGSKHGVDSRRRGRTTQLSPSIGPRSTGLRRRLVRRRGVRLQVEQRSFS